jgi:hypothetical protein
MSTLLCLGFFVLYLFFDQSLILALLGLIYGSDALAGLAIRKLRAIKSDS